MKDKSKLTISLIGLLIVALVLIGQAPAPTGLRVIKIGDIFPADIYVDADNGSDSNPGTLSQPLQTLHQGRINAQSLANSNCPSRVSPIVVALRGHSTILNPENYFLTSTEVFSGTGSPNDNGCSATVQTVYSVYPGEFIAVSGGQRITGWTNTSSNIWTKTLTAGTYFENIWYNGERRERPRGGSGVTGKWYRMVGPVNACSGACTDRFQYNAADTDIVNYVNLHAQTGNACGQSVSGNTYPVGDTETETHEKWSASRMRISGIDFTNHIICLTGNTQPGANFGFIANHRFQILNIKDNFSTAGTFFLDRSTTNPVLTYLAKPGENPNIDSFIAPSLIPPIIQLSSLQHVRFEGITFSHDNTYPGNAGYGAQQADFQLNVPMIKAVNISDVWFDRVTIAHTMGHGLWATTDSTGTSSGVHITNSLGFDCGSGCYYIGKFPPSPSDTDSNVMQLSEFRNVKCIGYGRVNPASYCLGVFLSHDIAISQIDCSDGYSSCVGVCIPTAANCKGGASSTGDFNITLSKAKAYSVGQGVTDDFGCFYMVSYTYTGNSIQDVICHDVNDGTANGDTDGYGGNGVYIDNVTALTLVKDALVYNTTYADMKFSFGPQVNGQANTVTNNIFAFGRNSLILMGQHTPGGATLLQFILNHNYLYADKVFTSTPSFSVQGNCAPFSPNFTSVQLFQSNLYFNKTANFATDAHAMYVNSPNCSTLSYKTFSQWQTLGEDAGSQIPSVDPFVNAAGGDFTLSGPAQVGFVPFSTASIGINPTLLDLQVSPTPIPGYPIATFTQADF